MQLCVKQGRDLSQTLFAVQEMFYVYLNFEIAIAHLFLIIPCND